MLEVGWYIQENLGGVDPLLSLAHTLVHCFKYLDQRNGTLKRRPSSTVDPFTNLKAHMPFICFYACICPCLYTHMPCTLMYLELVKKNINSWEITFYFSTCIESSTAYKTLSYCLPYLIFISTCEIRQASYCFHFTDEVSGAWTGYTIITCPDSFTQTASYKTKDRI